MPMTSSLLRAAVGIVLFGVWGCGGSVATLEFVGVTPPLPKIGEVATVQFKLTDYRGQPLAGQSVTFALDDPMRPGVTLSPLSGTSLKGSGLIETQIVVTNRIQSVRVTAVAGDKTVTSPPIGFAGGSASGRQFTFQCGKLSGDGSGGVHNIGAYDNTRYLIAGVKLPCIAHVADRNGDGLAGAVVTFITEAGTIGPSETSVADVLGNAEILHKTSLPLPKDVTPGVFIWNPPIDELHTGEYLAPLWMHPFRWTTNPIGTIDANVPPVNMNNFQEPRRPDPIRIRPDLVPPQQFQNNPRDNLVAMIAMTSGEEGFTDSNNNGVHDMGETLDDLTEPFVDYDDNGTFDMDEKFVDTNNNGKWDGKNGTWDQNTVIWKQERILWTGIPDTEDYAVSARNPFPSIRAVRGAGGVPIQVACFDTVSVDFILSDPWFNSMPRNSEGDGCQSTSTEVVKVTGGLVGRAFTYPSASLVAFGIQDALDRKPAPMTNSPGCFAPTPPGTNCTPNGPDCYGFGIQVDCKYTASPLEGHTVIIGVPVRGRIFKNLP